MFEFKSLGADTAAYHSTRRTPAASHLSCLIFYHMPPVCQTTHSSGLTHETEYMNGTFLFSPWIVTVSVKIVLSLGNNYTCCYELLRLFVDNFCLRKRMSNSFDVIVLMRHVFHQFYARRLDNENDKIDWFAVSRVYCNRKKNRNYHWYVLYA